MTSKGPFSFKIYDSGIPSPICLPVPSFPLCTETVEFIDPSEALSPTSPSSMPPRPLRASSLQTLKKIKTYSALFSFQLLRIHLHNGFFNVLWRGEVGTQR